MQQRKNFIAKNDGFTCEVCNVVVPAASGTSRNHCPQCLTSKHVDQNVPGDRLATCGGSMPVTDIEGSDPDTLDIVHTCETCGKTMRNRLAPDDNKESIFRILTTKGII